MSIGYYGLSDIYGNIAGMVNGRRVMSEELTLRSAVAAFSLLMVLAGCVATEQIPAGRPLYDRLGGTSGLSSVIEQFVINVLADTRVNGRFATTDIRKLKTSFAEYVCTVAGGPCTYSGRDLKVTYAGMKISHGDFEALVEDLVKALDAAKIPAQEKKELLQLLGSTKNEIVEYPAKP